MPSLAAALLVGLTAMAAMVPGAKGPDPHPAAPTSAATSGTNDATAHRLTADGTSCDKVHHDSPSVPLSHDGLYGYIAEYGLHLLERFFELLRASFLHTPDLAPETAATNWPVSRDHVVPFQAE